MYSADTARLWGIEKASVRGGYRGHVPGALVRHTGLRRSTRCAFDLNTRPGRDERHEPRAGCTPSYRPGQPNSPFHQDHDVAGCKVAATSRRLGRGIVHSSCPHLQCVLQTLVKGTESFRPVIASRNLTRVSRKLVPIVKSRFVLAMRFLGQWSCEGGIRQGVEAGPAARVAARRALDGQLRAGLRGESLQQGGRQEGVAVGARLLQRRRRPGGGEAGPIGQVPKGANRPGGRARGQGRGL
jgi:hypothetical protein